MNVGSGTFILCRDRFYPSHQDNPAYRSAGSELGYHRGFSRAGYVVEDPLSDPNDVFEGQGLRDRVLVIIVLGIGIQ